MPIVTLANQKRFTAAPGISVIDAARAAGLMLEHSCRSGRCGSCKAQVVSGRSVPLDAHRGTDAAFEPALNAAERSAGWILTCTQAAESDLQLDIQDLGALAGLTAKTLPCRIHTLDRLAPDVLRIQLRLPPSAGWRSLPGQAIDVIGPAGVRRTYSIAGFHAAAAGSPALIELHVRRVAGGALSGYWFETAKPHDLLRFEGPIGSFYLRDVAGVDLAMLATGTGIAPIRAMLDELAARPPEAQPRSLRLLWGGRTKTDLYLDFSHPAVRPSVANLRYTPVLSRADGSNWLGAKGYVQDVLLREAFDSRRSVVYACGSPAMIEGARARLRAAGLPPANFHADAFVASSAPAGTPTAAPDEAVAA